MATNHGNTDPTDPVVPDDLTQEDRAAIAKYRERREAKSAHGNISPHGSNGHNGSEVHDPAAAEAEPESEHVAPRTNPPNNPNFPDEIPAEPIDLDPEEYEAWLRAEEEVARWFEGPQDGPTTPDAAARYRYHIRTFKELSARLRAGGARRFLVDQMLPLRSTAFLVGDSGIGKSALLFQFGLCVAAGVPFFGRPTSASRVLCFDFENDMDEAKKCICVLAEFLGLPMVPENFQYWNAHDPPPDWSGQPTEMFDAIRAVRPALVIVDTLSKAFPEIEEKNTIANKFLRAFTKLVSEIDGTILLAHHFKKNTDLTPQQWEAMTPQDKIKHTRGASALFNGCDLRLIVDRPKTDEAAATARAIAAGAPVPECAFEISGFRRMAGTFPTIAVERVYREAEPYGYQEMERPAQRLANPRYQAVFEALPDPFRPKDVETHFPNSGSSVQGFLKACRTARKIVDVELGPAAGYRSTRGYRKVVESSGPPPGSAGGARPRYAADAATGRAGTFDPYKVLGVNYGASSEEIHAAYRDGMAKYHPDKVAHLGVELQEIAHRMTVDLNRAWEILDPKKYTV
jgi:hypothetical protein